MGLFWTIYCECATHLGGLGKYFDVDMYTLYIRPNEELGVFYSNNLVIQYNIDTSKANIDTNILISI